jgi:hypothetical protein
MVGFRIEPIPEILFCETIIAVRQVDGQVRRDAGDVLVLVSADRKLQSPSS